MSEKRGVLTGVVLTLLGGGAVAGAWWLAAGKPDGRAKTAAHPVPATVGKPFDEAAAAVTLTADAEARLGIRTAPVERKPMPRARVYGAEIVVLPGRAVIVSAPLAGTLKPAAGDGPVPGAAVAQGEPIFQLLPLLDPVGQANLTATTVDAEGQVQNAIEQQKAAGIALDRAKRVLAGGAGSQRLVDEAQAQADVAAQALAAATARRTLLRKVVGDLDAGTATPIPVAAPVAGVLRAVSARPGQSVPAGAALFEVIDLDRVWVRVPVYVGDLAEIDPAAPAAVAGLTARPGDPSRPAAPVAAPPAANPAAGTVDRFYALDNREARYSPGERVGATLPLKGPADSLTVPWAAVVYDTSGGAWVYEKTGDRAYARRRVAVRYVAGDTAVLAAGPPPGTAVVVAGVAELFGTETGFSK